MNAHRNPATLDDPLPVFAIEEMSFSIGKTRLLHPLTIDLPAKGVIELIGHNGSGKSALVKILAGQQEPSSGKLRFMNRPLAEYRLLNGAIGNSRARWPICRSSFPGPPVFGSANWWQSGAIPGTARLAASPSRIADRSKRR